MTSAPTQPIWLFSMDSDQFQGPPTTTATLQAYYQAYGQRPSNTQFELIHFHHDEEIEQWQNDGRLEKLISTANQSTAFPPLAGLSFYTWNAAGFLQLAATLKQHCPQLIIIAGGPHVQQAEDYLFDEAIDIVVLGEGEQTFSELINAFQQTETITPLWQQVPGIAWLNSHGEMAKTAARDRIRNLDSIPSALDVLPLTDNDGQPLYEAISYETSRGCPYKCAFCEWGTGAIGTKMLQFSMERIRRDWETIVKAGIKDIWLADSNYGALKTDLQKAELLVELKQKYGLPSSFATSWSKNHSKQVQSIVRLLHAHELLPHYQLALQTLTPLALELSHRENMKANQYEPIAKQMAEEGVPIAGELIWGLPGDNLRDFESNLNELLKVFPNVNIFGYTLLPGTEFYEKREQYRIKTVPVAGYGKAHGEYVIGCHTFSEEEGMEGYFLISSYIIFVHGYLLPLTTRYLALLGIETVNKTLGAILRGLLHNLVDAFRDKLPELDWDDRLVVYENRATLYLTLLEHREACFQHILTVLPQLLEDCPANIRDKLLKTVLIDELFCPRTGSKQTFDAELNFNAELVKQHLESMQLPPDTAFIKIRQLLNIFHSGGAGDFLQDPDGGSWIKGKIVKSAAIDSEDSIEPIPA